MQMRETALFFYIYLHKYIYLGDLFVQQSAIYNFVQQLDVN